MIPSILTYPLKAKSIIFLSLLFSITLFDYIVFNCRYNDIPLIIDQEAYDKMREAGIDHLLAQHIAHLFIRDPVSLFSEKVNQNDEEDSDHFEVKYFIFLLLRQMVFQF